MASNDSGVSVGNLSSRLSQYLAARGLKPASVESSACVSPARVRAARSWRHDAMFDMISLAGYAKPVRSGAAKTVKSWLGEVPTIKLEIYHIYGRGCRVARHRHQVGFIPIDILEIALPGA
jgi:hypothetical protein